MSGEFRNENIRFLLLKCAFVSMILFYLSGIAFILTFLIKASKLLCNKHIEQIYNLLVFLSIIYFPIPLLPYLILPLWIFWEILREEAGKMAISKQRECKEVPTAVARADLVRKLTKLSPGDLATLVMLIEGAETHISRHGTVREQVAELLCWAESPLGPGLEAIQEAFKNLQ